MAKDYKDTSKPAKRGGGGVPGPIWFVAGLALGVILTVVYRVGTPQAVERELARNGPADAPASAPAATIYVLQVGAFRTEPEADKLRAQLALLGVEAKIQKNVVDDKDTWFRVRVGPIKDEAELARLRARLDENKIKFMTLRGSA